MFDDCTMWSLSLCESAVKPQTNQPTSGSRLLFIVRDVQKGWGFDFRRDAELEKATFGQYSTELFTSEAEKIIANHNTSQVCINR